MSAINPVGLVFNEARFDHFTRVYHEELTAAVRDYPQDFIWTGKHSVTDVVEKMMAAIRTGSYSHDGRAIKATLKRLGIKATYKAVREWLTDPLPLAA